MEDLDLHEPDDERHPFMTLYCGHCGEPLRFQIGCGDRTCPHCRRKWFGHHYNTLHDLVRRWDKVHALTLTLKNIPDNEFSRAHVLQIRRYFSKLRKKYRQIAGGFYVVQATNRGRGWHLHIHVLFEGSFVPQKGISEEWLRITGDSKVVHVNNAKNPKEAVKYLLSDFSGAPRIRPQDVRTYNAVFRGLRLVQPFGKYRTFKFKKGYPCPKCGTLYWTTIEELLGEKPRYVRGMRDGP